MSFVARPTIPAPKASYVEGLRAKEREGKKTTARAAAAAAPKQPFKTALVLNGGGLLPVASAYGIFRGLYKANVGDVPCALNQFDVMAGASLPLRLGPRPDCPAQLTLPPSARRLWRIPCQPDVLLRQQGRHALQRQRVAPQAGSGQLPQHQGELGPELDYVARSAHG